MMQSDRIEAGIDVAGCQQGGQGRGKAKAFSPPFGKIKRLDAQTVPAEGKSPGIPFVDGEGKHAVKALRGLRAPGMPGLQHDFGVAIGEEAIALLLQLAAEVPVVVDAAVEGERQAEFRIYHRLLCTLAQVDDLEPAMSERHAALRSQPHRVGSARSHGFGHPGYGSDIRLAGIKPRLAAESAHDILHLACSGARQ